MPLTPDLLETLGQSTADPKARSLPVNVTCVSVLITFGSPLSTETPVGLDACSNVLNAYMVQQGMPDVQMERPWSSRKPISQSPRGAFMCGPHPLSCFVTLL